MKRHNLFFIIAFLSVLVAYSQLKAYYMLESIDTTYKVADKTPKITFFFPTYERFKSVAKAYEIKEKTTLPLVKIKNETNTYERFESLLFIRFYASNIKNIYLQSNDACSEKIIIPVKEKGYNEAIRKKFCFSEDGNEKNLQITYDLVDAEKPYKLIFADLWVGNSLVEKKISPSKLFQKSPFNNAAYKNEFSNTPFDSYGELKYFPKNEKEEDFKGIVHVEGGSDDNINKTLTGIIFLLLQHYPFYENKNIQKDTFISSGKAFLQSIETLATCKLIDTINNFLSQNLNDPHFYIKSKCHDARKITPVYSYQLNGKHIVAAVIDETLKENILLGSEILEINHKKIASVSSRVVNEDMLKQVSGTNLQLTYVTPQGEIKTTSYQIEKNYKIPPGYKPQNFLAKKINDSVSYFKINNITYALPLAFLNNFQQINASKKLVLDFRGCTGGDFLSGAQFLSYFINGDFTYFDYENMERTKKEAVIVRRNKSPYKYRKDGKIILLVDESTACMGELLVHTLRDNRKNTLIVGKGNTKGALAFVYEIVLFDGISVLNNSLDTGRFMLSGKSIEGTGLTPDVQVVIDNVYDLQPYNDKALVAAISK